MSSREEEPEDRPEPVDGESGWGGPKMEIMVSLDAAIMRGPMFKDGSVKWWRWLEAVLESAFGVEISVPQMGNLVTVVASRLDSDLMEAVKELKRLEQQHSLPPPKDKDPNAQPTGPYQLGESPSVVRSEPPETPSWRDEIVEVKVSFPARLQHLVFGQTGQAEQKKRHEDRLAVRLTTKDDLPDEITILGRAESVGRAEEFLKSLLPPPNRQSPTPAPNTGGRRNRRNRPAIRYNYRSENPEEAEARVKREQARQERRHAYPNLPNPPTHFVPPCPPQKTKATSAPQSLVIPAGSERRFGGTILGLNQAERAQTASQQPVRSVAGSDVWKGGGRATQSTFAVVSGGDRLGLGVGGKYGYGGDNRGWGKGAGPGGSFVPWNARPKPVFLADPHYQQQNGKGSGDWKAPDGDGGSSKGEEGRFGFPKWEEPEVAETGKEAFVDTELGRIMEDADELVIADAPRAPPPPRWQRPPPPKLEAYSAPWPRKTRPPFHAVLQSHRGRGVGFGGNRPPPTRAFPPPAVFNCRPENSQRVWIRNEQSWQGRAPRGLSRPPPPRLQPSLHSVYQPRPVTREDSEEGSEEDPVRQRMERTTSVARFATHVAKRL